MIPAWRRVRALLPLLWAIPSLLPLTAGADKTPDLLKEVLEQSRWRSIGPATMGGRVADIATDEKNPYTFYVALATGGLLKTTNNGQSWAAAFDKEAVASVGAVAVAPSDSKIVWLGTGEANGRNSSSWGDGVYKSTDSGATWKNMGLKDTQEIGRIVIDASNPDIVYVAAAGHLWGANKERGIYKTVDGGKTWQPSLVVNENVGAIDVALGAPGSNIVYAVLYERRRTPWGFSGINPGSALYKSADAGKTWKKMTNGLPAGVIGRAGISVCKSKPTTVYAVIESQQGGSDNLFDVKTKYGGIFRSDDAGETWKRVNPLAPRGFYFGQIRVDPTNTERVYVLGFELNVSDDGGKTFKSEGAIVHADWHAMWIDPVRPERILAGTDGGVYASYDKSKTWEHLAKFPMGEFYEVSLDNRTPFWAYGGLQDNGSWGGPSARWSYGGPVNSDWLTLNGGDGFYVLTDPTNPDIVYAESQGGFVARRDRRTNMRRNLYPNAPEGTPAYRFNWNTPICLSPQDHTILYVGGNRVFKWTKEGKEWEAISPDLSKQDAAKILSVGSGAETYGTVVSLAASPVKRGVLWAGTDDGNVQVTQDEGKTWTNVTNNLPGDVRELYVKRIEASHFEPGRAYVAIDGHRSERFAPYLFVTEDYGTSWKSIHSDLPAHGPVKAIRESPVNPNLLFAGTEFSAFVSIDRGAHWHKLDSSLPTVAVDDLAIQPRDHALVAATHGRSLFVLDNLCVLEELNPKTLASDLYLFPIPPAVAFLPDYRESSTRDYEGQNSPSGAEIVYWQKALLEKPVSLTITDSANKTVETLSGDRLPGLHRLRWDLRQEVTDEVGNKRRRFVKPGVYIVTLTLDKTKLTQKVTVSGDGALSETDSDQEENRD